MDKTTMVQKARRQEQNAFAARMAHVDGCNQCITARINDTERYCGKGWQLNAVVTLAAAQLRAAEYTEAAP